MSYALAMLGIIGLLMAAVVVCHTAEWLHNHRED